MKRKTKARLSTIIGCALSGVTLMGPYGGDVLAQWQCNRGLCSHPFHWHRYKSSKR